MFSSFDAAPAPAPEGGGFGGGAGILGDCRSSFGFGSGYEKENAAEHKIVGEKQVTMLKLADQL